jgi:CheY-like chemotaxis protein
MSLNRHYHNNRYPLILIVAEDSALRRALQDIFEFTGYATLGATCAREGLKALSSLAIPPDLIISDLLMDSDLFYQAVRAQEMWRELPFIILTSQNRAYPFADRRSKRQDRAIRLSKPFPVDDLLSFAARFTNDAGTSSAASFTETA